MSLHLNASCYQSGTLEAWNSQGCIQIIQGWHALLEDIPWSSSDVWWGSMHCDPLARCVFSIVFAISERMEQWNWSNTHRIHVGYIYLHEWLNLMVNVGKYTIRHGSYGNEFCTLLKKRRHYGDIEGWHRHPDVTQLPTGTCKRLQKTVLSNIVFFTSFGEPIFCWMPLGRNIRKLRFGLFWDLVI